MSLYLNGRTTWRHFSKLGPSELVPVQLCDHQREMEEGYRDALLTSDDSKKFELSRVFQDVRDPKKIEELKEHLYTELFITQTTFNGLLEREIDSLIEGISAVSSFGDKFHKFEEFLQNIPRLTTECNGLFEKDYETIREALTAYKNASDVKSICKGLRHLPELLMNTRALIDLQAKGSMSNDEHPRPQANDMIKLHYQIIKIDRLLCNIIVSASGTERNDLRNYLRAEFNQLDESHIQFEQALLNWTEDLFELLGNNPQAFMEIMKIIEYEEQMDQCRSLQLEGLIKPPSKSRNYLVKFKRQQEHMVENRFREFLQEIEKQTYCEINLLDSEDVKRLDVNLTLFERTLKRILVLVQDLEIIQEYLVPRAPHHFDLFHLYIVEYHRNIREVMLKMIEKMGSRHLSPKNTLFLLRWIQDYYNLMESNFGIKSDSKKLQPTLWNEQINYFMEDYVQIIRIKLDKWIENLIQSEKHEFSERKKPPEIDNDGKYTTGSPSILFQLVNQQIEICTQSNRGSLLHKIILECCDMLKKYQDFTRKLLRSQTDQFLERVQDSSPGIVEYWMAIANNHLSCQRCFAELNSRLLDQIDGSLVEKVGYLLSETARGFNEVTIEVLNDLVAITLSDVQKIFENFFTDIWYMDEIILVRRMISTLTDYRNDFKKYMIDSIFGPLMETLSQAFVVQYLRCLIFKKDTEISLPNFFERALEDKSKFSQFFLEDISPEIWYMYAKVWQDLLDLVSEPQIQNMRKNIILFREIHPDCEWQLLEKLFKKRKDLETSTIREMMKQAKSDYAPPIGDSMIKNSIFSRIHMV